MKKLLSLILCVAMIGAILVACDNGDAPSNATTTVNRGAAGGTQSESDAVGGNQSESGNTDSKPTASESKKPSGSGNNSGNNFDSNEDDGNKIVNALSVTLNKQRITLVKGSSETLIATVLPSNTTNKALSWTSSNERVATVYNGKVTAVSEGTATIYVKTSNGKKASCSVTVDSNEDDGNKIVNALSVTLNKQSITLVKGSSETLIATVLPSNTTNKALSWTSSNERVATVYNGKVTAVSEGTATIYVKTSNGKKASCSVTVEEYSSKGLNYLLSADETYYVLSGRGSCTDSKIVIPDYYEGKPVKKIGQEAFFQDKNLVAVVFNSKITEIGIKAFKGCSYLSSVTLSNSLEKISNSAFELCNVLEKIDNLESSKCYSIGEYAFYNCYDLNALSFPNSIQEIGMQAFYGCSKIKTLVIPNSATKIGSSAFNYCNPIKLTCPANALSAFGTLSNLEEAIVSGGTTISSSAFSGGKNLKKITLCDSITSIGYNAFCNCSSLTSITIPSKVTSIGISAFEGCSGLTSITIPNKVTSIGDDAFNNCTSLKSITIPDSVTKIPYGVLYGCSNLSEITIPFVGGSKKSSTDTYQYPFGYIFGSGSYTGGVATEQEYYGSSTSSKTKSTYCIPKSLKKVTVTGGSILYGAFDNCSGLTSVTIGNSVTSIGNRAFYGCSGLTSVTIGNSVTSIDYSAFSGCSGLTSITIPFIGATKNGTGYTHFGYIFGASSYSYNSGYVPSSLKTVIITGGTSISNYAFYNCGRLTSIEIPNSVTSIGEYAFSNCYGLTSIKIPNSVTSIGEYAFRGCSGLTSITVAAGNTKYHSAGNCLIKTASKTLIAGCKNSVIPTDGSVTSIGGYAFYNCSGLTSIEIPNSVTRIGEYAFYNCDGLTSVTIGNGVTSIGERAFSGCDGLTSVAFKNPDGWFTAGVSISSSNLSNTSNAAKYLTDFYDTYYWTRS